LLYVPGSDERKCLKAFELPCDSIIFDLEDAVSPDRKSEARRAVVSLLSDRVSSREIMVRVNQVSSAWGIDDLMAVAPKGPSALVIPKARVQDLVAADVILGALEDRLGWARGRIGLMPLIETAEGLETINQILGSAKRITAVQLGAEDLSLELGLTRTALGEEINYARSKLVMAARWAGVTAVDTPFVDYKDPEAMALDLSKAKSLGVNGKTAIHPSQLEAINYAFTPSQAEVEMAEEIVRVFETALAEGRGACSFKGKMIDAPIAERNRAIVKKNLLIQSTQNDQ
jgi:citrate lyase subunit beta/citryl-CoA lyase